MAVGIGSEDHFLLTTRPFSMGDLLITQGDSVFKLSFFQYGIRSQFGANESNRMDFSYKPPMSVSIAIKPRATQHFACLLLLSTALSAAGHVRAQQWQTVADKDGIRMEARAVSGERFDELRVSTSLKASPETVADYLFGKYLDVKNKNIDRTFIQRGREIVIWSDVLRTPVVSERCYSMRFERKVHSNGEIRVKFSSLDYVGKKPTPDCISLHSRGEWIMTPTDSGTRLIYASLTDIGGKVPAVFASRSLSSAAIMSVRKVVAGASGLPLPRGIGD